MMKIAVYNSKGIKGETREVKATILDTPVNPALIHEVVVAQLADRREAAAKVKTRAEVAGGGKKPYKQKGTGRARTGSIRNPLWRGGGTIFGPTGIQNFTQKVLKKKRRGAVLSALATRKDNVIILDKFELTKTKEVANLISAIPGRNKLMVFVGLNETPILSTRNLKNVRVADYRNLNVYDLLWSETIVFVGDALEKTNEYWEAK
jgi:large subunit ribosomal protein L4